MGIDVGFGQVKGYSSLGHKTQFPSVIGEYHPVGFISGLEGGLASNLVIEYNYKRRFVGETALKQSIPQSTIEKERTVNEEGLTLLVSALALLSPPKSTEPIKLVVGLPVMHFEGLKSKYINVAKTTHIVDLLSLSGEQLCRKHLFVEEAKVLPQPFGTFFDNLLNDQGEVTGPQIGSGKIGVLDIGYNTLDLLWVDKLEYINPRSTSFSGLGMFTVFQSLTSELYRNFGVEIPLERIEPIIRTGEMKLKGQSVDINLYKRAALKAATTQIVSKVKSIWPDSWELDQILITGGGAILLGDYLLSEFGRQATLVNNPVSANSRGYLKFAHWTWK